MTGGACQKSVILHIGLSKTGTSFLQAAVFPKIPDIVYVSKTATRFPATNRANLRFLGNLSSVLSTNPTSTKRLAQVFLRIFSSPKTMLISYELLSMRGPGKIWSGAGKSVSEFTQSLAGLKKLTPRRKLKIILAFRDPATWCASRYAESSKVFDNPSQKDFERRVFDILSDEPAFPAFSWLHRSQTLEILERTLGSENIHSFQLEQLSENPQKVVSEILSFMGLSSRTLSGLLQGSLPVKINVRRDDTGSWLLEGSEERLVLPPHVARRIREHFADG